MDRDKLKTLQAAVGRSTQGADLISERLVASMRATLEPHLAAVPEGEAPLGLHWCLAPPIAPMAALGRDGHPAESDLLPTLPLPRRMWAGGALEFFEPLTVNAPVLRRSTLTDISAKQGRSGWLCFVTIRHEFLVEGIPALTERQDLVYREHAAGPASSAGADGASAPEPGAPAGLHWRITPDPVLLFRYSALTFTGHRIHYDHPYATGVETYEGLVVHGPLQASWLLNLAAAIRKSCPRRFEYRLTAPLICDGSATVLGRVSAGQFDGTIRDSAGRTTAAATAEW